MERTKYHVMSDSPAKSGTKRDRRFISAHRGMIGACGDARELARRSPGQKYIVARVTERDGNLVTPIPVDAHYQVIDGRMASWVR